VHFTITPHLPLVIQSGRKKRAAARNEDHRDAIRASARAGVSLINIPRVNEDRAISVIFVRLPKLDRLQPGHALNFCARPCALDARGKNTIAENAGSPSPFRRSHSECKFNNGSRGNDNSALA